MTAEEKLNLFVPSLIAMVAVVIFFLVHPAQKFSFVPAMALAFICYLRTSYRKNAGR